MKKAIIALSAMLCVMACREKPAAKQEQAAQTDTPVIAPDTVVIDETRLVIIFPDQVDETGDVTWYGSLTGDAYEKLGIERIVFNEAQKVLLSFALDKGKRKVIDNLREHKALLYKKGKEPISVGWLDSEGYTDYMESHWKTVAKYLGMKESEVIKRLGGIEKSKMTDKRDGRVYKTVKIGNQTWMAENLNYDAEGSKCYDNDPANCEKYGRLYNWETAKTACPAKWHLPSQEEWTALENAVGGSQTVGKKLKSKDGWENNGNGTDDYGFSALPGSYGSSNGSFYGVGYFGYWWSSSEHESGIAYARNMLYDYEDATWYGDEESRLLSVRCLQD